MRRANVAGGDQNHRIVTEVNVEDARGGSAEEKVRARVLVVDDHDAIRESLVMMVGVYADVCGTATDGEDAIAKVEELQPDVVLMDIKMPGMDGITATLVIKRRWPAIKVIAHTAYSDRHLSEQMLAAGADDYMLKGGDLGAMLEAIFDDPDSLETEADSIPE